MVTAAPPSTPLAFPTSPPLRAITPVAARLISRRPAPGALLSLLRAAAADSSSLLLAVPVPMDPVAGDLVAKQVCDPPPLFPLGSGSVARAADPSPSFTLFCRWPRWRHAHRSGTSPERPTCPSTSCCQ
jgi:hypothetical protein